MIRASVYDPMVAGSGRHDTPDPDQPQPKGRVRRMAGRRPPDDEYSELMHVVGWLSRLFVVTTSGFALIVGGIALVAIAVALILSL